MINISINKEFDKEVFSDFWGFSVGGVDFGKNGIEKIHPKITNQNYKKYIDNFYIDNKQAIFDSKNELERIVNKTQDAYFKAIYDVFGKDYSGRSYTCLLSIFDCNPRYVEEKRFHVFYERDTIGKLGVVYHEISHFAFFEHAKTHCSSVVETFNPNEGSYWALSEIFNIIILNTSPFQDILKHEEHLFYPMLTLHVDPIKKLFEENCTDFCAFLSVSLFYLETAKK